VYTSVSSCHWSRYDSRIWSIKPCQLWPYSCFTGIWNWTHYAATASIVSCIGANAIIPVACEHVAGILMATYLVASKGLAEYLLGHASFFMFTWVCANNFSINQSSSYWGTMIQERPPPDRWLSCALPTTCTWYFDTLQHYTATHHLTQKLDGLFSLAKCPTTSQDMLQEALEKFDQLKLEGMQHAKQHCCHFNMGLVKFSPALNFWRKCWDLWKLVLWRKSGFPVKAKYIHWLAQSCQICNPLLYSQEHAAHEFQMVQLQYFQMKPDHDILQQEFFQSRLHDPTLSEEHHKAIACLISLESIWDSYYWVQSLCSTLVGHSISAVKYNLPTSPTITVSCLEVEQVLSKALSSWFMWAHGFPFLQAPLAPLVGSFGMGEVAQAILQGTFL